MMSTTSSFAKSHMVRQCLTVLDGGRKDLRGDSHSESSLGPCLYRKDDALSYSPSQSLPGLPAAMTPGARSGKGAPHAAAGPT